MSAPIIEREGDDFVFSWAPEGVRMRVENIRDSHDALKAEITVESTAAGADGVVLWEELNLKAGRTRVEMANRLAKRVMLDETGQKWALMLDLLALRVKELYRRGEPVLKLCEVEFAAETPYLVGTLLPEVESTILYGDGEAGKSLLSRAVALSLWAGIPLVDGFAVPGGVRTLILDYETNGRTHARWLSRLAAGMGVADWSGIDYRKMYRPVSDEAGELRRLCAVGRYGLVIVDSLGAACGGDLNEAGLAIAAMNTIHSLGPTALVLAHISKEGAAGNGKPTIFGSGFFRYYARATWFIQALEGQPRGQHAAALFQTKANEDERIEAPIGVRFTFDGTGGPVSVGPYNALAAADARKRLPLRQQIAEAMRDDPDADTAKAIALAIDASADVVAAKLRQMAGYEVVRVETTEMTQGRGHEQRWQLRNPNTRTETRTANPNVRPEAGKPEYPNALKNQPFVRVSDTPPRTPPGLRAANGLAATRVAAGEEHEETSFFVAAEPRPEDDEEPF